VSSYVANYLIFGDPWTGALAGRSHIPCTFADGTSNTVMYGEAHGTCGTQAGSLWGVIDRSNGMPYSYLPAMCVAAANGVSAPKGNPGQSYPSDGGTAICIFNATQAFQFPPGGQQATASGCWPSTVQSSHPGGMNVTLGDASVRFVSGNVTITTWNQACDPRDGAPLGNDW
jgi:hypothetical protein